jgi:integrase
MARGAGSRSRTPTLRSALSEAQRLQLVSINAATLVKVPKPVKPAIVPLDGGAGARRYWMFADRHRLGALFSVALACGLRLGEACGLRWPDVDLETGELQVRQQLQWVGKQSRVAGAEDGQEPEHDRAYHRSCVDALKAHRKRQLEERLKAGERWQDTGSSSRRTAHAAKGRGTRHEGRRRAAPAQRAPRAAPAARRRPKLPHVRFHDLRHSAASAADRRRESSSPR